MRTRNEGVDTVLLLDRRAADGIVVALRTGHRIHGTQRIVINGRRAHAHVIVVRAHEHVLSRTHGIGARHHGNHVAARRLRLVPLVAPVLGDSLALRPDRNLVHRPAEEASRNGARHRRAAGLVHGGGHFGWLHGHATIEGGSDRRPRCGVEHDEQDARRADALGTRVARTSRCAAPARHGSARTARLRDAVPHCRFHQRGGRRAELVGQRIAPQHHCWARRSQAYRSGRRREHRDLAHENGRIEYDARVAPAAGEHRSHRR